MYDKPDRRFASVLLLLQWIGRNQINMSINVKSRNEYTTDGGEHFTELNKKIVFFSFLLLRKSCSRRRCPNLFVKSMYFARYPISSYHRSEDLCVVFLPSLLGFTVLFSLPLFPPVLFPIHCVCYRGPKK